MSFYDKGGAMDIPIHAKVICQGNLVGTSILVIINPETRSVTHLVVRKKEFPVGEDYLIPVEWVKTSSLNEIHLTCSMEEFDQAKPFVTTEFINGDKPLVDYMPGAYLTWPYISTQIPVILHKEIPHGELAIGRGAQVLARDGYAGRIDEFLVNAADSHISHLVLREGHLWGQKDITIPVTEIESIGEDGNVHLKLSRQEIGELPAIPLSMKK
jgi:sporulation protein YlmC with PRC-barrel domain